MNALLEMARDVGDDVLRAEIAEMGHIIDALEWSGIETTGIVPTDWRSRLEDALRERRDVDAIVPQLREMAAALVARVREVRNACVASS
jgi:hypothetical protein